MIDRIELVQAVDSVVAIRAAYLIGAVLILSIKAVPILSSKFLAYGSRNDGPKQPHDEQPHSVFSRIVSIFAAIRVPHSWFISFYVISTTCSLFWASQIILNGSLFRAIASASTMHGPSMSLDQVTVTWALMLLQGLRRLYECLSFTKPSSAHMWIGHWVFGVWFYASINIAIWIEASPTLLKESHGVYHFSFRPPTFRTFVGIIIFLLASGIQHDCHAYLASLKKYTVPDHPVFQRVVCPHYLAECLIYLALAVVAAPPGHLINRTVACALVIVAVNLGVTADGTKRWYEKRFGVDSVKGRWRMIPFVF